MNFITRNIAWILLFFFFIFMLFIIAFQNPKQQKIHTSLSGAEYTSSGEEVGELDKLMKKIDTQQQNDEGELAVQGGDDKNISAEAKGDEKEQKESLFSRVFGKKEKKQGGEDKGGEDKKSKKVKETKEEKEKDIKSAIDTAENTLPKNDSLPKKDTNMHLVKSTKSKGVHTEIKDSSLPANFVFPGINLKTSVGQKYKIGVKSLKLNNRNFTQTLAYMMRGDRVRQLTPENARGCFLVEIETSQRASNVGKKGYACKKWLTYSSTEKQNTASTLHVDSKDAREDKTPAIQHGLKTDASLLNGYTQMRVGNQINVLQTYITQEKVVLEARNTLEQVTQKDENGCMKFLITRSNIMNIAGKVLRICQ